MLDRLITVVVAVFLALLVWLYARSRDQENLRAPLGKGNDGSGVRFEPSSSEDTDVRVSYELVDVPVSFLCSPAFPFRPRVADESAAKVTLRVTGPRQDELPKAFAFVDLTGKSPADLRGKDSLEEPIQVHLPRRFRLETRDRRNLSFQLIPTTLPAADPVEK